MGKGAYIPYTAKELDWIKANCTMSRREAHAAFCAKFRRTDVSLDNFKALCSRNGWKTGRTGCYETGRVPENKGKKMPYNANSARTQFKKGSRTGRANQVYKLIGTERVSKDGYLERKIHDGLPLQSRWRAVHLLNWEKQHGPLPKGMCLKCLDGNKRNTDAQNWEAIPRAALPFLNDFRGYDYDSAPAELKPVILSLAKLRAAKSTKTKKKPKPRPTGDSP